MFTNNGTEAMLRVIGDIVEHVAKDGRVNPRSAPPADVFAHVRAFLTPLTAHLSSLSLEEVADYKKLLGSAAANKYWRRFQAAIASKHPEFEPEGLALHLANEAKQFDADAHVLVREIEAHLKSDIRKRLEDKYAASWYREAVPQKVYQDATALAAEKQWKNEDEVEVDWWDSLHFSDYHQILTHKQDVWDAVFNEAYTAPSDTKSQSRKDKTSWMNRLIRIRNASSHGEAVTEDDFEFLNSLHSWLGLGASGRND